MITINKDETAKGRIIGIVKAVAEDVTALSLIADVLAKSLNYISIVNTLEHYVMLGGDDQDEIQRLDQRRNLAHNTLIDSVNICNRYLFKNYKDAVPPGGVYSDDPLHLSPENRRAIGNWAGELVSEVFENRR